MKILYQWALKNPTGWQEVDAKDWSSLPSRSLPKSGQLGGQDNVPGHIRNVNVQGITNEGFDHVAIKPITIGLDEGVKMTSWNDDPDDYPIGERQAIIWIILPLAPDPKHGMAINTRQSCVRYCEGERYDRLLAHPPQNTTIRPWSEFVTPDEVITRHGIWLDDTKLKQHIDKAPQHEWSWMHWCDHLPESETELETQITHHKVTKQISPRRKLKEQRAQGRYKQAEHTITYYQRDTNRAIGAGTYTNEDALEKTTSTPATESVTTNSSLVAAWSFTSPANEPNSADWPNGTFNFQFNCTAASAGITYGISGINPNSLNGGLRLSSDLATVLDGTAWDSFPYDNSGTGLKLTSTTWNSTSGSATDVVCYSVVASGTSHGDAITLQLNTTDSYADGPWTTGPAPVFTKNIFLNQSVNRASTY